MNEKLSVDNKFIMAEFLICGLIVFFNLYYKPEIVSILFTISFVVLAAFFLYTISRNDKNFDLYGCTFGIIVISVAGVLFNSFDAEAVINFENLRNYIMFCSTIIFMFLMLNIEINKKTAERILILNIAISMLYPIAYTFFPQVNSNHLDVSLNFSNPNLTGMWILQSLLYLSIAFLIFNNKYIKIFALISFFMDFYLLELTGARNCMISFFLFGVLCLIVFFKGTIKLTDWFMGLINIAPISFVFVYLTFIEKVVDSGILDFLISKGKKLTSRVEMWERFLGKIEDNWLIGSYYTAGGNAHNSHLVILCSFGLITLLLTIYFTYKICCKLNQNCRSKASLYCLGAFFAIIFMGLGEGALYSGAMGIYIMASGFIYISRAYNEDGYEIDGGSNERVDN